MREPRAFTPLFGVLNLSLTIACALDITLGFYGYIQFGENSKGSITLNLTSWYGVVAQLLIVCIVFVCYGLQFYVPMVIIGDKLTSTRLALYIGPRLFDYLFRATIVLITYAVAALVDNYLGLLISLIGSLGSTSLALIFPPLLEIITFWPIRAETKYYRAMCVKDCAIMCLGITGFITGIAVNMRMLITDITSNDTSGKCPPADK